VLTRFGRTAQSRTRRSRESTATDVSVVAEVEHEFQGCVCLGSPQSPSDKSPPPGRAGRNLGANADFILANATDYVFDLTALNEVRNVV
jgi:hypothetical protein